VRLWMLMVWCVCVWGGGQLKRTERAVKAAEKELAAETVAMIEREKKAAKEAQGRIDDVSTGTEGDVLACHQVSIEHHPTGERTLDQAADLEALCVLQRVYVGVCVCVQFMGLVAKSEKDLQALEAEKGKRMKQVDRDHESVLHGLHLEVKKKVCRFTWLLHWNGAMNSHSKPAVSLSLLSMLMSRGC
jgi:hypothetical protein